jgi:hypothetical protein
MPCVRACLLGLSTAAQDLHGLYGPQQELEKACIPLSPEMLDWRDCKALGF